MLISPSLHYAILTPPSNSLMSLSPQTTKLVIRSVLSGGSLRAKSFVYGERYLAHLMDGTSWSTCSSIAIPKKLKSSSKMRRKPSYLQRQERPRLPLELQNGM